MFAFHILAMNPHTAEASMEKALDGADTNAVFVQDSRYNTTLDHLPEYNFDGYFSLVRVMCIYHVENSGMIYDQGYVY